MIILWGILLKLIIYGLFILHSFILKTHYETDILCRINIFHRTQKGVNWISIKTKNKHTYNKQFHSWSHEWNCKRKNVPLRILLFLCIIHDEQKHRISICIGGHLVWDALFFVSNRAALDEVKVSHFLILQFLWAYQNSMLQLTKLYSLIRQN